MGLATDATPSHQTSKLCLLWQHYYAYNCALKNFSNSNFMGKCF